MLRSFGLRCVDTDDVLRCVQQQGFAKYDHDKWRFIKDISLSCDVLVTNMFKLRELVDLRGWKVLILPTWWDGTPLLLRRPPLVDEIILTPFHVAQAAVSGHLLERFIYNSMGKNERPTTGLIERSLSKIVAPGVYAVKITETVTFTRRFSLVTRTGAKFNIKFLKFERANSCAYFEATFA